MAISDQIKEAIRNSGLSLNQLSKEAGVSNSMLSRFLSTDPQQHRDIRLEATADKLATYFGLILTSDDPDGEKAASKAVAKGRSKSTRKGR